VVVWVFAGGGEAEVRGLIPFLQKNFPGCQFERKTPARIKPGPKPGKVTGYGKTGKRMFEKWYSVIFITLLPPLVPPCKGGKQ